MTARHLFLSLFFLLLIAACSAPPSGSLDQTAASSDFAQPPHDRLGLGTKWGETRKSAASATTFLRATPTEPLAAELFYNDQAGIEAMAAASEFRRVWPILREPIAGLFRLDSRTKMGIFFRG